MSIEQRTEGNTCQYIKDNEVRLIIEKTPKGRTVLLKIIGNLGTEESKALKDHLNKLIEERKNIELDMSGIRSMSPSMCAILSDLTFEAGEKRQTLKLVEISQAVYNGIKEFQYLSQRLDWNREVKKIQNINNLLDNAKVVVENQTNKEEEKRKQEEEKRKQEEEKRKQEEEKRKREEEKRKQEEKHKQEEEQRKQEEKQRKQEEEKRKQEEEQRKQEEEQHKWEEKQRKQEKEWRKEEDKRKRASEMPGTIKLNPEVEDDAPTGSTGTVKLNKTVNIPYLVWLKNGYAYSGQHTKTSVGRDTTSDICLKDIPGVSGKHTNLIFRDGKNIIVDYKNVTNPTVVNGKELARNEQYEIDGYAIIELGGELFIVLFGALADQVRNSETLTYLKCLDTDEIQLIKGEDIHLGRLYPWPAHLIGDGTISREHAAISKKDGRWVIESTGTNGTKLNGKRIDNRIPYPLKNEDCFTIGQSCGKFRFCSINLIRQR